MRSTLIALALLLAGTAAATEPAPPVHSLDRSDIDGRAGAAFHGVAGINLAAGTGNVQANVRAVALTPGTAAASAHQAIDATGADMQRDARAVLAGSAFESAQGILGLNQAAGSANAQLNVLAIGPDAMAAFGQQIDNLALAAIRVEAEVDSATPVPAAAPLREARIDGAALRAPSGILQLNQTAGAGNASANAIVLQLPGGTP